MHYHELRNPIDLRSPMRIHTVMDLDYVMFPKYVLPDVRGLRMFKTNGIVVTHEYLPPDGMEAYYKLFKALPDGIQFSYNAGQFVAYDLVCFDTHNRTYKERYAIMEAQLKSLPICVFVQHLVQDENDFGVYCTGRCGFVYLREPRGLYYQGNCPEAHQTWLRYELAKQSVCTIVELVGNRHFVAEYASGMQILVTIRLKHRYSFNHKVGDNVIVEFRSETYNYLKGA